MKRIVMDIDGTLAHFKSSPEQSYKDLKARPEIVDKLHYFKKQGFEIILHTARGMGSRNNSIGLINAEVLPELLGWLSEWNIPFDEIHVGKPWCGTEGFYVDDRAIRPSEFESKSQQEIKKILEHEYDFANAQL